MHMWRALIEYFAWGLLLTLVIASIAIVHRELRGIIRPSPADNPGKHRQNR